MHYKTRIYLKGGVVVHLKTINQVRDAESEIKTSDGSTVALDRSEIACIVSIPPSVDENGAARGPGRPRINGPKTKEQLMCAPEPPNGMDADGKLVETRLNVAWLLRRIKRHPHEFDDPDAEFQAAQKLHEKCIRAEQASKGLDV